MDGSWNLNTNITELLICQSSMFRLLHELPSLIENQPHSNLGNVMATGLHQLSPLHAAALFC
jgi:hypothetical protein